MEDVARDIINDSDFGTVLACFFNYCIFTKRLVMQLFESTVKVMAKIASGMLLLLIFSTSANAFVGQGCPSVPLSDENISNLKKVAIIGKNKPWCLNDFVRKQPENGRFAEWVSKATLPFVCNGKVGNAVYVKTRSKRILVSVSHIRYLIDRSSLNFRIIRKARVDQCTIKVNGESVPLDVRVEPIMGITEKNPAPYAGKDFMVLAVREPLDGVPMIPIAAKGRTKEKDFLYAFSAQHATGGDFGPTDCPTVVSCSAIRIFPAEDDMATDFTSDCSLAGGVSGGPVVGVDPSPSGGIELRGLQVGDNGDTNRRSGEPYNEVTNYASIVAVDGPFGDAVWELDNRLSPKQKYYGQATDEQR